MAEYLQAPPRRKALGLLADALTSGQEALNTVNLPYVGGLGGLLFGQAPQYLQDVSYGMPAFRGGNVATGGLGTFTPDTRMLDVATLPFVGAGAAKAGQVGAKTLGKEVARQVETGTGLLGSNVLDPRQYATAYHGSPYMFDQFDIGKVGRGEGAQAYGHGVYFAENPKVAEEYRNALKFDNDLKITTNGDVVTQKALAMSNMDKDKAISMLKAGQVDNVKMPESFANYMVENTFAKMQNPSGTLYKVDIPDTSIPKMLDWDKPIKEQKSIMQALKKASKQKDEFANNILKYDLVDEPTLLGKDLYDKLNYQFGENQSLSSDYLSKFGLKGIKYLDEGSRGTGKGTSNFVVFDPSQVKILERNNKGLLK